MRTDELAKLLAIPKLPIYEKQVEKALEAILVTENSSLRQPSLRLIKSGGKRLRPFLTIAAASSQQRKIDEQVIRACSAIELIHIGTIVHDDIIDNANIRWGVPTINSKEGVDQAILVGDYLLALASVQAAGISTEAASAVAITIATMSDGQSQETANEYSPDRSIDDYMVTIYKKTAALTSAACRIGGLCAGLPAQQVEILADYGKSFGLALQLLDDLLDFLSTTEAMGKPVGNDMKEGIYTLPLLLALQGPSGKKIRAWLKPANKESVSRSDVVNILVSEGCIELTLQEIRKHNQAAAQAIRQLGNNKVIDGLSALPNTYLDWALSKQTVIKNR